MDLDHYQPRVAAQLVEDFYPNGKKAGESRVITCPFCLQQHSQGAILGHRAAQRTALTTWPSDIRRSTRATCCAPPDTCCATRLT